MQLTEEIVSLAKVVLGEVCPEQFGLEAPLLGAADLDFTELPSLHNHQVRCEITLAAKVSVILNFEIDQSLNGSVMVIRKNGWGPLHPSVYQIRAGLVDMSSDVPF